MKIHLLLLYIFCGRREKKCVPYSTNTTSTNCICIDHLHNYYHEYSLRSIDTALQHSIPCLLDINFWKTLAYFQTWIFSGNVNVFKCALILKCLVISEKWNYPLYSYSSGHCNFGRPQITKKWLTNTSFKLTFVFQVLRQSIKFCQLVITVFDSDRILVLDHLRRYNYG